MRGYYAPMNGIFKFSNIISKLNYKIYCKIRLGNGKGDDDGYAIQIVAFRGKGVGK